MCEKRSSVINVIISNWSAHFWGISHPSYWNYFIWRTIPTEFNQPSNCSFSDMWPLSPPLIRETKIFSHAVVSAAASSKLLEYLKWRYLPHVWVLKDPHYSLDTVHCDALLETAETCRRTKREKSAVSVRRRRHAALQLRIWPRFRWRPLPRRRARRICAVMPRPPAAAWLTYSSVIGVTSVYLPPFSLLITLQSLLYVIIHLTTTQTSWMSNRGTSWTTGLNFKTIGIIVKEQRHDALSDVASRHSELTTLNVLFNIRKCFLTI